MDRDTQVALTVAILFLVFIAYEIAGGSDYHWARNWHTVSYFASRNAWLKWSLLFGPPAVYMAWWPWHLSHPIGK